MRHFAPAWVYSTCFALAAVAGYVNSLAWLGAQHKGISHVTGALTEAGVRVASVGPRHASASFVVLAAFAAGAVLSGLLIGDSTLRLGRRYGVGLLVESALLVGAYFAGTHDRFVAADCLAAAACGLQNALATNFSGASIRTTHMTGVLTDLGLMLGQAIRLRRIDAWRFWLFATLLAGFFLGVVAGALASAQLGHEALLVPAGALAAAAVAYWVWRQTGIARGQASDGSL
jgi:uncharacterized membrane protein YoaK (UPF0700 family)